MTSLHVICGLGPQSKILATLMNSVFGLTGLKFEPQTSCSRDQRVSARLTWRFLKQHSNIRFYSLYLLPVRICIWSRRALTSDKSHLQLPRGPMAPLGPIGPIRPSAPCFPGRPWITSGSGPDWRNDKQTSSLWPVAVVSLPSARIRIRIRTKNCTFMFYFALWIIAAKTVISPEIEPCIITLAVSNTKAQRG